MTISATEPIDIFAVRPPSNGNSERPSLDGILETVALLSSEFVQSAADHDRTGTVPAENIKALYQAGLLGLVTPLKDLGWGYGLPEAVKVVSLVAQGEPSTALILAMHYLQHGTINEEMFSPEIVKRIRQDAAAGPALINALRVEPELGTPARGGVPATRIKKDGTGWLLNGHKVYSTGIPLLKWLAVWVATDEAIPRIGTVLVPNPSPGIEVKESWDQAGMRATASHEVIFNNVAIDPLQVGELKVYPDQGGRDAKQSAWSTLLVAAVYDGIARAAFKWFLRFIRERKPSNLGAPLSSLARFQEIAGRIEVLLSVNERLVSSAAQDSEASQGLPISDSGIVKLTVTSNAIEAVELMLKATGNPGLSRKNPLERHYRDVLCGRIHTPHHDAVLLAVGQAAINSVEEARR